MKHDIRTVDPPDEPSPECTKPLRQRYIYERIEELGHPTMLDKPKLGEQFGVSRRQIYNDIDEIAQFVEEHMVSDNHVGNNMHVFEKAKREAIREGDWQGAVSILKEQAEWLEDRGKLDKEPEQHEVTWRNYIADDEESPELDDPDVIDVE